MTRLDRYILGAFVSAYLICATGFIALYVVLDAFENLDAFRGSQTSVLAAMGAHYGASLPLIYLRLAPAFTLVAAMFVLVRLNRSNEITAMKASGVSVFRILLPLGFAAVLLSAVMAIDQEHVLPVVAKRFRQSLRDRLADVVQPGLLVDIRGNVLEVDRYLPARREAEGVRFVRRSPEGRVMEVIVARVGRWIEGRGWVLHDGEVRHHDQAGDVLIGSDGRIRAEVIGEGGLLLGEIGIRPLDLESQGGVLYHLRFRELESQWRRRRLPHLRTQLHQRYTWPVTNLVLLLVGLPFAFRREGASVLVGFFQCLAICLAFFVVSFYAESLGSDGTLVPVVAAWFPIVLFGSLAIALFDDIPK